MASERDAAVNTDRELYRESDTGNGAAYSPSIHMTEHGNVGIDVGGHVFVLPLRSWHALAASQAREPTGAEPISFQWKTVYGWQECNVSGTNTDRQRYARQMADRLGLGYRELYASALSGQGWRSMESAPKDEFILLYCAEDGSRWLAKWQNDKWFGADDKGLTRSGATVGDPNIVTGWFLNGWQPLPAPPGERA